MVIVLEDHAADTPVGKPVAVPIPVAPVVVWVIAVRAVLIHKVGVEEATLTVFAALVVKAPVKVLVKVPQVPVTTQ